VIHHFKRSAFPKHLWVALVVALGCGSRAGATQFVYVQISCNNYPVVGADGKLQNAERDGSAPRDCRYFSNVVTSHVLPDPGEPRASSPGAEEREEQERIRQRAKDAFGVLGRPCQRMVLNVSTHPDSKQQAEESRRKFMASYGVGGKCVEEFEFFY
jgi:hypothetical protein